MEVASEAARSLASEIAATLDPACDYAEVWNQVLARRKQERGRAIDQEMLKSGRTDEALRAPYERNLRLKVAGKRVEAGEA